MPTESFRIESRRVERAKRAQTAQHVFAAFVLITNAWSHLQQHVSLLAVLELAAGLLLVGAAVRERVRHRRGAHHEAVGVVEIAGAVMTFIEAMVRTLNERHHTLFYVLLFVQPVMLLIFGIFDVRFAARRVITADDDGIAIRFRLLFGRRVAWSDIRAFRIRGDKFELVLDGGGTRAVNLRDLKNRDEAVTWMTEQLRRRGVEELLLP